MMRLRWQIQHLSRSIGLPGWVGVALLLACAIGWWLAAAPLRDDTDRLVVAGATIERRLAPGATATTSPPSTPRQQLAEFQRRFTGDKGIATALGRLQAAAQRQGIHLDHAEFKLASDASQPLQRYTIVLPVKADYPALRQFTRDALLALPGLAIEEVSLRRNDPKSTALEAQLRLVLFLVKAN